MRILIQKVSNASITINHTVTKKMNRGLVALVGFENDDTEEDLSWTAGKLIRLRVFEDNSDVMNLSVQDVSGELMVVSQFTLHASTKKGNRPSYIKAATPDISKPLYEKFLNILDSTFDGKMITGEFGAHMHVDIQNDGPVTIFIDSKNKE